MLNRLPDWIDPVHCAEHDMRFHAHVNQTAMKRLLEQVEAPNGEVEVDIQFRRHPRLKTPQFSMRVQTRLRLVCQRTLEAFEFEVDSTVNGLFLASMQMADEIDEDVEVYELSQGNVSLLELVEEELLLAVPMIPRKDEADLLWSDSETVEHKAERENPFALLARLKKDR
jgi:uncharacterized protein